MPVAGASALGSDAAPRVIGMVVGGGVGAFFLIFLGSYAPIPLELLLGSPGLGLALGTGLFSFRRSWPWGLVAAGLGYAWTVFVLWLSAPAESGLVELARNLPTTSAGAVHLTGVVLFGLFVGAGWRKGDPEERAESADFGALGAEDDWTTKQARPASCAWCPHLFASRCGLRSLELDRPRDRVCANHPDLGGEALRSPLGPVFHVEDGALRVVEEWRPTPKERSHLIDVLAEVESDAVHALTFRERVAIRESLRLEDREARVHLDRIEDALARSQRSGSLADVAASVARRDVTGDGGRVDTSRISLPGRLLLLSALAVGGASFLAQTELTSGFLDRFGAARFSFTAPIVIAFAYLAAGLALFRLLGIPFRTEE